MKRMRKGVMQNGHAESKLYGDFYRILVEKSNSTRFETLFDYLRDAIAGLGTDQSFYTLDFADVLWKVQLWKEKMSGIHPYYAVKANSDPVLLRLLVSLGFSFDCATKGEIEMTLKAGADPKNIIFAHVIKSNEALRYSASVGVDLMTFDSQEELLKIHTYFPSARLVLRLSPENVKCSFDLSGKFGCDSQDAEGILTRAKDLKMHVVGVSFHVGGLCKDPGSYTATIRSAAGVFQVAEKLGFKFTILDIGGGFSGEKASEELFDEMTQAIRSTLKEYFKDDKIEIIAEPGTFFIGSAVTLTTPVLGKKIRSKKSTQETRDAIERYYYLNDSIYGSFFKGVEEYGVKPKPLLEESVMNLRYEYKSKLFGQSCCGEDLLWKECSLPDMEEGEFIVWENTGAYCQVLCSTFCAIPIPTTKYVFINNDRLTQEWISNIEEVTILLSQECSLINTEL